MWVCVFVCIVCECVGGGVGWGWEGSTWVFVHVNSSNRLTGFFVSCNVIIPLNCDN